jgi:hypothetical protein
MTKPKTVKEAIALKSKAAFLRELRDLTICPECGTKQIDPKMAGDDCENEECECYVVKAIKYLYWTSPNWG